MAKTMSRVPALSYENFPVLVSVYDASGQKFDNFSTFDIAWSVSSSELVTLFLNLKLDCKLDVLISHSRGILRKRG